MNAPIVSLRKDYVASTIDWEKVAAFLAIEIQPFFGNQTTFSGTQQWKDVLTVEKEFNSMKEWSKLPHFPIELIRGTVFADDYKRHFEVHFWFARGELGIRATVYETEQKEAVVLIHKLEGALELQEKDGKQSSIRVDTHYALTTKQDHAWLENVLTRIGLLFSHVDARHGELQLISGATSKFEQIDALANSMAAAANAVDRVSMYFYFPANTIWVRWHRPREEFDVEVSSPTQAQAIALTQKVADIIGLQRLDGARRREGISRFGFVQGKFDAAWFAKTIAEVRKLFPRMLYSMFELTREGEAQSPRRFNDIESWLSEISTDWTRVWHSSAWIESAQRMMRLAIWHREYSARLQIEMPRREDAEVALSDLAAVMELKFTEENPYRKAVSSSTYAIKTWQDAVFAELVRDAVPVAVGKDYWVVDAWIREAGEQGQPVRHAKSLDDYLKLLSGENRFVETDLRVYGPRGRVLRIHVYDDRSRLRLTSSLPQKELDNIAEAFKTTLRLKTLKEAESAPAGQGEESRPKSWWMRALPAIGAALLTLIFSTAFLTAIFPQYHISIISPLGGKDAPRELATSKFRVVWRVQKEHLFQKNDLEGTHANISVLEGGTEQSKHLNKASGELVLTLPPGSYTLILDVPSVKASEITYFTIPSTNSLPSPAPAPTK